MIATLILKFPVIMVGLIMSNHTIYEYLSNRTTVTDYFCQSTCNYHWKSGYNLKGGV